MNHTDVAVGSDAHSPDVPSPSEVLHAELISAVRRGDCLLTRDLLAAGASPNLRVSHKTKQTLLHLAAGARRDCGLLSILLAAGARVNARDARWETPLMTATRAGRAWAVRLLVAAGASPMPDARRGNNSSAPQAAREGLSRQRSHARAEVLRMLDKGQESPQQAALLQKLMAAVEGGRLSDIRRLLARGAPINGICPRRLEAPLHRAVARADMKVLRQLLLAGADVNLFSAYGRTPLMRAMGKGRAFVVTALLQAGADVNKRDAMGRRALDYCSDSECRHLLRAHGALRGKEDAEEQE